MMQGQSYNDSILIDRNVVVQWKRHTAEKSCLRCLMCYKLQLLGQLSFGCHRSEIAGA